MPVKYGQNALSIAIEELEQHRSDSQEPKEVKGESGSKRTL